MNRTELFDANGVWKGIVSAYSVGQDVTRPVHKVVPALGVFVRLEPGFDALIHVSKISGLLGGNPSDYFVTGQKVFAKIIDIDSRTHRVQLETELGYRLFHNRFLTQEYQVVVPHAWLDDVEVTSAMFQGSWIWSADSAVKKPAHPMNVRRIKNGTTRECQVQLQSNYDEYLKCVCIRLRDAGGNIEAKVEWTAWTTGDHQLGYDFINDRSMSAPIATCVGGDGYGVPELQFRVRPSRIVPCSNASETVIWKGERQLLVEGTNWETWRLGQDECRQAFPDLSVRAGDTLEIYFRESLAPDDWKIVFFDRDMRPMTEVGEALGIGPTNEIGGSAGDYQWKLAIPVTEELAARLTGNATQGFAAGLQCKGLTFTAIVHRGVCKKKDVLLVDGSNIVRVFSDLRSTALAVLLECLNSNGYAPICFFDANIEHVMRDTGDKFGQELLARLKRVSPKDTIIVPGGTRSDDFMLAYADKHGYSIISCDTFKDPMFREKYPWLSNTVESGKKRIHAPLYIHEDLLIPTLGIAWSFNG